MIFDNCLKLFEEQVVVEEEEAADDEIIRYFLSK